MKHLLILTCLFLPLLAAHGADPVASSLHFKPQDIERVVIELESNGKPQVRVYLDKSRLGETQTVVENNLNKPVAIYMNDTLVVEPTLKEPLKAKIRYLTFTFNDFDTAAQVARGFVVTE